MKCRECREGEKRETSSLLGERIWFLVISRPIMSCRISSFSAALIQKGTDGLLQPHRDQPHRSSLMQGLSTCSPPKWLLQLPGSILCNARRNIHTVPTPIRQTLSCIENAKVFRIRLCICRILIIVIKPLAVLEYRPILTDYSQEGSIVILQ